MSSSSKLTLLLLVWTLPGLECLPIVLSDNRVVDLSDFQEFTLTETPGLGYCPTLSFQQAWIRHLPDDSYIVQYAVVEQGTEGIDKCQYSYRTYEGCTWANWDNNYWSWEDSEYVCPPECPVIHTLAPRTLTDSEVQRVLDLFSSLTIESRYLDGTCWDYCAFQDASWDDFTQSNDLGLGCTMGYVEALSDEDWVAIRELLEDLRVEN